MCPALALLAAALVLAPADDARWPRQIEQVQIEGTRWTRPRVILRELPFAVPGPATSRQWELFLTRLRNMNIFSRVEGRLEPRGDAYVAVLRLEERFTLNPLVAFGAGGGTWWFRLGAADANFLGTYLEWGARYERFEAFNGAQGWLRDPRLFGLRLDGLAQLDFLMRSRPDYVRRRLSGAVEVSAELADAARVGGRVEVLRDRYFPPGDEEGVVPPALVAGLGSLSVTLGRVDQHRLRLSGVTVGTRQTIGLTDDRARRVVGQTFIELLAFAELGARWNVAFRGQLARSSNAPPELQYHLGGLDLVRGYPDSLVRTTAFALFNAELRLVAFDSTWFAVMPAVFVDGAVAEAERARPLLSAGAGIRLVIPRFIRTGLRADFALALAGGVKPGISLGVYQFF